MPDYIREAKRARRERDFSKAGDLFYLAGDEKAAMEMYLKGSHFSLAARLLEKNGDWKGAARYHLQAGKIADAAEIYYSKLKDYRTASALFEKNGDLSRASDTAEKAGDIFRAAFLADQAELLERAAHLYVQAQKYEKAAVAYSRLLRQLKLETHDKIFLPGQRNQILKVGNAAGTLFLRQKKYDEAAECFEEIDQLDRAAECYSLAGKIDKAAEIYYRIQDYDRAYELMTAPEANFEDRELLADVCFYRQLYPEAGDIYLQLGKIQRAAESFEKAGDYHRAALFYESLEDHSRSAELYLKLNEIDKAAKLYEKSKQYEVAAKLYEEAGLLDRAIGCLTSAGRNIQAAKILIERDEIKKAVAILQEIDAEQDSYSEACILLGQLFSKMEMYSVAQQKFNEAIDNQPMTRENVEIYYNLAIAYERAAQYSMARDIFERILSIDLKYRDVFDRLQQIRSANLLDGVRADATPSSVKRIVASRYELQEQIGKDPFGILYKALDTVLGRPVLIRRLPVQDKNITRSILEQTRIVSGLVHSNILTIYDSGKDDQYYFLCMEYVEGPTLRKNLSRGPMDISEVCELASQICLGLSYAHKKGVVHRNLCPENIYVTQGNQTKIANFGIDAAWERGNTLVSRQYSSPEQLMGQKVDGRADLYAFGVVLYEMIYGKPPFGGQDVELQHLKKIPAFPKTYPHPVPSFLLRIMQRCLQKENTRRYTNAEEILEELELADIVPGMVLNQRYEILREIGTGGMGHVYKARDRDLDETVALKVLRAEIGADPVIQRRFLRELKLARIITHPNVVKVFDTGKYKGNRYISMEYIEGISLDTWRKKNSPDIRLLLAIVAKIMQGVQAAHQQGIVHRDLKPQNVLLDRTLNPHVLDFGIARAAGNVEATSGQVLGSPKYMSPEQIQGKDLDPRSDIYSLGVMLFYLFAGEEPFSGEDPRSIVLKHLTQPPPSLREMNPEAPEWLEDIVVKALEKDRERRYSSLKELLEDLRKGYEGARQGNIDTKA